MKGKLTKKLMLAIGLSLATLAYPIAQVVAEPAGSLYRVRENANDAVSQIGAYRNLSYAKALADANEGYEVYNEEGQLVYAPSSKETTNSKQNDTTTKEDEGEATIVTRAQPKEESTNAKDTNAKETNDEVDAKVYKIQSSVSRYLTAYDANNNVNSIGTYGAGTYYIYKSANGMLNISKNPNVPGAWINPNGVSRDTKPSTNSTKITNSTKTTNSTKSTTSPAKETSNSSKENNSNAGTLVISSGTLKYRTAYDASVNNNSLGTFSAGTYYIYKTANGMVNISKIPGVPGAWINPNGTKGVTPGTSSKTTTTPTNGTTTPSKETGLTSAQQKIVNAVKGALGTPYVYGGESYAEGGFDCSGLAQFAYAQAGISIPRTSTTQLYGMQRVSAPQAGDLVIYSYGGDIVHTGIYVGNGQIIHAPDEGEVVSYHNINFNTLNIAGYVRGY